jgi:hypothetical protein
MQRAETLAASPVRGKYDTRLDRESAHEILARRAAEAAAAAEAAEAEEEHATPAEREYRAGRRYTGTRVTRSTSRRKAAEPDFGEAMGKMVMKELTGTTGRRIVRGILGGLFKGV